MMQRGMQHDSAVSPMFYIKGVPGDMKTKIPSPQPVQNEFCSRLRVMNSCGEYREHIFGNEEEI